jgi:hypothetical protein
MNEATLLESRLSKVERDNRRLKLALGALLLALAAVPLIGAVMPEQIPEVIEARAFQVIDENGERRADMSDEGFAYWDENDNGRAEMSDLGISYYDENGNVCRLQCRLDQGSVGLVTPSTGAVTTYPAQVVLYDADGTVLWSAGGR